MVTTPYQLVAASAFACACAGAGAKPASAPVEATTTQDAATANQTAPDRVSPANPDALPDISQFKHARDDDEPRDAVPAHDPDARHPAYWQELTAQIHRAWILPAGTATQGAVACLQLLPDGRIAATRLTPSGDAAIDDSIQRAMTAVQRAREEHPVPVPADQQYLIKRWICFRFDRDG